MLLYRGILKKQKLFLKLSFEGLVSEKTKKKVYPKNSACIRSLDKKSRNICNRPIQRNLQCLIFFQLFKHLLIIVVFENSCQGVFVNYAFLSIILSSGLTGLLLVANASPIICGGTGLPVLS